MTPDVTGETDDHISAKKEKVEFRAAFMLHSIGNIYLPCSRHILDPGDVQVRKRSPLSSELHKYDRINYPNAMMCQFLEE